MSPSVTGTGLTLGGPAGARRTTLVMTAVEALAIAVWFLLLRNDPATLLPAIESYLFTDLLAVAPVLVVGLSVENTLALERFAGHLERRLPTAFGLAVTETVIWSLWVALVVAALFSPRGIGPALLVATVLFVLQHALEMQVTTQRAPAPFTPGVISTSVVEATAGTTLWVFATEGELLLGLLALLVLLGVEHEARLVGPQSGAGTDR